MNKVYTYLSEFSDRRLPTEYPFKDAVLLYSKRFVVICVAVSLIMVAATIIALAIVAVQAGYWYVVLIIGWIVFSTFRNGGGGGYSPPNNTPPSQSPPRTTKQSDEQKPTSVEKEKVYVLATRPKQREKLLEMELDEEVIEVNKEK